MLNSTSKNRLFRWVDFFLSGRFEHFLASNWWFFGFFSYFWSISIEGRVQKQIINKENAFWSQLEAIRPLWTFNWYTNLCGFYPGGLFRQIFLKISHCVGRKSKILRFLKKKKKSQKASKTPYLTIRKGLVAIRHVSEELVQISHNFDLFGGHFFGFLAIACGPISNFPNPPPPPPPGGGKGLLICSLLLEKKIIRGPPP